MSDKIVFKGLSISRRDFELKYNVELSDIEWNSLVNNIKASWQENVDQLRLLAFRHIKEGMKEIGYGPSLEGNDVVFKSQD
ncbi:hypothetical protein [Fulvivirga sp.]|uniref:hypothetical protein n=1 Tax=Fulvivirga sp. TaxID=1931237 RepID=UPI0032EC8D6A